MYTRLTARLLVRPEIRPALDWLNSGGDDGSPDERHPLFLASRVRVLFTGKSAYHETADISEFDRVFDGCGIDADSFPGCVAIEVDSSIKNYGDEIELFVEWIRPYVLKGIVLSQYEENRTPDVLLAVGCGKGVCEHSYESRQVLVEKRTDGHTYYERYGDRNFCVYCGKPEIGLELGPRMDGPRFFNSEEE